MKSRLIIGTRRSRLALLQTESVRYALLAAHPGLVVEIIEIVTRGDRVTDRPLPDLGGKGLFTAEIESALLEGRIDLAVHSMKDLPVELTDGLTVAATPKRADARDALVCREASGLDALPEDAVVGTSSPRRAAQLAYVRADLVAKPLRGNVDTRLEKLGRGDYDAIVVAAAAMQRLGRLDEITQFLEGGAFLPAPAQGALAVETREDDPDVTGLLEPVNDADTYLAANVERRLLMRLGGGCHLPLGTLAEVADDGTLSLRAVVSALDGSRHLFAAASGPADRPADVVDDCYHQLARQGATGLLR